MGNLDGDSMGERVRIVRGFVVPVKGCHLEAGGAISYQPRLVLLSNGKIGMKAGGDRHSFITPILHRQGIGKRSFTSGNSRCKGKFVRIAGARYLAAGQLHFQGCRTPILPRNNRPGQIAAKAMNWKRRVLLFKNAVFETRKVGDHQWKAPAFDVTRLCRSV